MVQGLTMGSIVLPGQILGSTSDSAPGDGTYVLGETIHAAIHGMQMVADKTISVQNSSKPLASKLVLRIGDSVLCKVIRTTTRQAFVNVFVREDLILPEEVPGIIRKEDIRSSEVDSIVVQDIFRAKDIVRAKVLSIGDSRSYYLSTLGEDFGVLECQISKK